MKRLPIYPTLALVFVWQLAIGAMTLGPTHSANSSRTVYVVPGATDGAGSASVPDLTLPFPTGENWELLAGPHTWNGTGPKPWSSLDFAPEEGFPSEGRVLAAGSGTVHRDGYKCKEAFVRIDHGGGWSTSYYHLVNIPEKLTDGQKVRRGEFLGNVGQKTPCGGTKGPKPHVHFTLWKVSGAFDFKKGQVPLDGANIGGWTVHYGTETYLGTLSASYPLVDATVRRYFAIPRGVLPTEVWTADGEGKRKSTFQCTAEPIQFHVRLLPTGSSTKQVKLRFTASKTPEGTPVIFDATGDAVVAPHNQPSWFYMAGKTPGSWTPPGKYRVEVMIQVPDGPTHYAGADFNLKC